ncbi:uroporphyrinogen-III C-methyltransferase [Rhabdobacter roseus]|uniref:uroporphyrinogen-III C-methyltransferase n=1 Tax=Rhabdobacter roseus TaxID=1655419 RepID=A0A840TW90_9BACT|nr:uroporphyrinogen-III C-methyltransferase [Rhabdobacter roseus]MBB5285857.1 uroporphyrin-III C-methyltransferase [Rhabdobacter roseus]
MKLTLIGAGPGDPELITLKAVRALNGARVVLYDALVHPSLLEHCSDGCVKVPVGKRFGKHSCSQDVINYMIVEYAYQYGEVVRLKGGDPYVFGRGYEEVTFAARHGIESEVIPGISSSYAVPALAGIPLTTRGVSESFWVVTGTTQAHQLSLDLRLAAQSSATVVVLMGVHKLPEIVETYASLGKLDQPIAIIQNGTLPDQKIVTGRISNILPLAHVADIGSPAIIVIGPAAALPDQALSVAQKAKSDLMS